ncbi:MAG: metal ABC transporter ATP-binding protein [Wujia sp.]
MILSCEDVSLGYEGKAVVEHLNFQIHTGDYLCILGENGSGKSTLMKAILGMKKPMSGRLTMGENLKANEIGYLPQQTVTQRDFPASVQEIVMSGFLAKRGMRPFYSKEERKLATANMKRLEIESLRKKCYRDLSGGQQQRVLLARALCATTKLLLLDEPVAGLDPRVTVEMYELIKKLNREGITVIMVSHDVEAAAGYANKILHVSDEPVFFEDTKDFFESRLGREFVKTDSMHA